MVSSASAPIRLATIFANSSARINQGGDASDNPPTPSRFHSSSTRKTADSAGRDNSPRELPSGCPRVYRTRCETKPVRLACPAARLHQQMSQRYRSLHLFPSPRPPFLVLRSTLPASSPVITPSFNAYRPLTITALIPAENWCGSLYVARSVTDSAQKIVISA